MLRVHGTNSIKTIFVRNITKFIDFCAVTRCFRLVHIANFDGSCDVRKRMVTLFIFPTAMANYKKTICLTGFRQEKQLQQTNRFTLNVRFKSWPWPLGSAKVLWSANCIHETHHAFPNNVVRRSGPHPCQQMHSFVPAVPGTGFHCYVRLCRITTSWFVSYADGRLRREKDLTTPTPQPPEVRERPYQPQALRIGTGVSRRACGGPAHPRECRLHK